jgi:hypothetical protein
MRDSRLPCHEHFDEGRKQCLSTFFHVVLKLKESEIERKSLLRYTSVGTKPGAEERPKALWIFDIRAARPEAEVKPTRPRAWGRRRIIRRWFILYRTPRSD